MKQVLSLLVAFVFMQVQTWALSGGPVYPGNATSLSGTYAGTITGEVFFDAVGGVIPTTPNTVSANGSGVFVIGQPASGLGSGVFAILFLSGTTYTGSVIAVADPGLLTMNGVMEGQANVLESPAQVVVAGVVQTSTFTFTEGHSRNQFQDDDYAKMKRALLAAQRAPASTGPETQISKGSTK